MRQTKHALTFLSSSYQAVFKHAYAAGLASSAVMLSLSSPYALAAVNADWDDSPNNTTLKQDLGTALTANTLSTDSIAKGDWVVGGSETYDSNLTSTSVTINTGNSLTVSSNAAYDTSFYSAQGFNISGGTFTINGADQDKNYHMKVQASAGADGVISGSLNSNAGTFNLHQAEFNVDAAFFENSIVKLSDLTASSGSTNSDLFANYTSLNTGLNGSETKVNRTNVYIGDHAAFNAVGKLSFTNRSSIDFQGASTSNGAAVDIHNGENAAKSQLRAESAEFYSDVGNTRITAQNGASAGVFVNALSVQDTTVTVNAGAQMQFAGLYNNTMAGTADEIQAGTKLGENDLVDTNFQSGTMTISGDRSSITNNGKLTFGATSIVHDTSDPTNPQAFTASAVKYTVNHNSGLFNNNAGAFLNIGDDFDATSATHFKAAAGQGTTYNLNSGTLNNLGTINVHTGSALNVNEVAVFTADSASNLNIASGGSVSMHAAALSAQSGDQYSFGQNLYTAANLSNLGNVSNSGTLNLNQGLFVADGAADTDGSNSSSDPSKNSLGYRFLQALNGAPAADLGIGQVFVNDAILMLESGTQLDTSSSKLQGSQIAGSGSSTLYSAGQVNFTVDNTNGEQLNGFSFLVAHDLTFQQDSTVSPENSPITLKPTADTPADQKLSFAATGSLNTANAQGNTAADLDLSLENTQLRLSSSQLMLNVTELAADQEPTITAETHELNANLVLNSGSELLVEAGTWQGSDRTITAQGDSQLKIDGQSAYVRPNTPESTDPTPFQTLAGLEVQKLELANTASATVTNSGSLSVGDLLLQNSGTLTVNSGSSLSSTGTMLVSGTASATIQDAQALALNALRINTGNTGDAGADTGAGAGTVAGGMFVTNTDVSAQSVDLSNGVLQVAGTAATDPTDLTNTNRFVTTGHMALGNSGSGSAHASFNRVDVELGSLAIHNAQPVTGEGDAGAGDAGTGKTAGTAGAVDAGGMDLNAANLKVNGDVSVVNGALNFNQSFDTTAPTSGTTSLASASAANTTHSVQITGDLTIGANGTGDGQVNLHQARVTVDNVLINTADTTGGLRMTESNLVAQGEVSVNNGTLALGPAVTPLFNATAPEPYMELSVGKDLSITGTGQVHLNRVVAEADNVVIDADAAVDGAGTPVLGSGGLYLTDSTLNTNSLELSNGNFTMSNSSEQPSTIEQQLQVGSALLLSGLSKFELNAINGSAQGIGLASSGSVVNLNNSNFRSEGTYALDSQGQFNLTGSTFYADGNVQNQATGQLNAQNSTVQVFGNLVNSGSLNFNNSELQNVNDLTSQGSITATNGSELNIAGTMALGNGAQLNTDNSQLFTSAITGSGTLSFNNLSEVTIKSDGNGGTVDFAGAEVNLNSSKLYLGDAFNSLALSYDAEQGLIFGNNNTFSTIQTDGGATIYLDLSKVAGIENLTAQQLEDFKNKLASGNGQILITGVNIPSDPENPEKPAIVAEWNGAKQRWEIDYAELAQYYDKIDFETEETIKAVLTGTSGSVAGAWAGIETVAGTSSFDVYADDTLSINGHAVNVAETGTDHLAQDVEGNVVGVNLNSGSALNINTSGTGTIGNILETDPSNLSAYLNIYNADQIKIQATGGAKRSQILVGTLNSQADIHVQDVTTNQATFNGGGLNSEVVNVSGSLAAVGSTFKVLTSLNAGAINASNSVFNSSGSLTTQSFSGSDNILSANELSIGNVSGSTNTFDATTLTMGNLTGSGNTVIANSFTAQDLTGSDNAILVTSFNAANTDLTNSRIEADDITLTGAGKFSGGSITAQSFTGNELSLHGTKVDLSGDVTAQGQVQVVGNASLLANNLTLVSGDLLIGEEGTAGTGDANSARTTSGSSGKVVLNHLDLNGNNLFLDPEFGQQTATLFVKSLGDLETVQSGTTVVNGNLVLGRNTAMGLGGTEQAFNRELAKHQDATTHSLSSQGIGSYLYLDTHNIQLGDYKLIMGSEDLATLKDQLTNGEAKIYLGSNAGMQVTANALNAAKTNSSQIFSDLDSTDIIESTDGTLILPSGVTADDLASIFGEQVQLASGSTIKVQTANGLYSGVIDSVEDLQGTGDFEMSISKESRYILREVSDPTYNYYLSVMPSLDAEHEQQIAQAQAQAQNQAQAADTDASASAAADAGASAGAGYLFLSQAGSEKSGRIIEQSARLASFGMGVQIAHQTAQTTADAISQRLGLGQSAASAGSSANNNNLNVHANNGTAVWFSPSYQNYQSSSFKADNLHYGSDISFYGMVAGIDHTFVNGVQVGAVLNIGQGDASGEGIASGVNNNFNYYGAGVFASVQPMPNLTLSADAGYNFVSSDLESSAGITGYDKVTGDADSQALTAGVKAQYQFKALGMDFAPHAGVRYTRISLDSYDFKADGQTIGHTDTADADVLSIPLGVVLSTTLKANDWVIQPQADLTVTANIGADSIGSESSFEGAEGSVKYDTEFMDKFTYGVAAGLNVRKGNFQAGANVGYTGSSNTQEVSAQGTVQYKF